MIYFTADTHFDHEKAINFPDRRNFTVESWKEMMFDKINSLAKKGDRLYILGDFAVARDQSKSFAKNKMRIKCKDVWLIRGNHDMGDEGCKRVFGPNFRHTYDCKIRDKQCWLSHYQHLTWPASHYGSFHLHGHTHFQRSDYYDSIIPEMRVLDVCPESYKAMFGEWGIFSEDQVYEFMMKRKGHDDVSWYKANRGEL